MMVSHTLKQLIISKCCVSFVCQPMSFSTNYATELCYLTSFTEYYAMCACFLNESLICTEETQT